MPENNPTRPNANPAPKTAPAVSTASAEVSAPRGLQTQMVNIPQMQGMPMMQVPISGAVAVPAGALMASGGGNEVKIVLKNAKIHVEKLVLKKND